MKSLPPVYKKHCSHPLYKVYCSCRHNDEEEINDVYDITRLSFLLALAALGIDYNYERIVSVKRGNNSLFIYTKSLDEDSSSEYRYIISS
jgi:hypothetical protein